MDHAPDEFAGDIDARLILTVRATILANPKAFREAARKIDKLFSSEAARPPRDLGLTDAERQRLAELARARGETADGTGDERSPASHAGPDARDIESVFLHGQVQSLDHPAIRFAAFLRDLLPPAERDIDPLPEWDWAALVLLAFWLAFDPKAERQRILTTLRDWPWEPVDGVPIPRCAARWVVRDAGVFHRAVRSALASAEQRGLLRQPAEPRMRPLTQAEEALIKVLAAVSPGRSMSGGELLTAMEKAGRTGTTQGNLTGRLIPALRDDGWELPNRGTVGYGLSDGDRKRAAVLFPTNKQ